MSPARLPGLATLLGLGACALTPPYRRPDAPPIGQWREAPQAREAEDLRSDWWRDFRSDELDRLMARALAQNFDLAAAVARVDQANAQARISGAALLPQLDATGQIEKSRQARQTTGPSAAYQLGGQASYEVDFWGRNRSAYNEARETAAAAAYDREVVRLTTESAVANSFFQTIGFTMRLAVARQNLTIAQTLLDALRKEFVAGLVTQLDVTQQEAVVAAAAATIAPLQQQQSQSLDALAILVGTPPEQIRLATNSLEALTVPAIAPGLPSTLLRRRPDVRESEAQLRAANYDIGNARAQFFPDINLTAQGGVASTQLATLFTPQGLVYDLIASLAQPLFEGGRLRGQLDYARARYREQLADYSKAVIAAFSDVEDGLAAVARSGEALAQQEVALAKARTALRMIQAQFRAGTVNSVQVLQIEQNLFTQEDAIVQGRLARFQALVGLAKALGGGWSDAAGPAPAGAAAPSGAASPAGLS